MASNNPTNSDTSLPRGLLGKGGTPLSKSTRLPSVRTPRDLTLGGIQKKAFKPNIPVRPTERVSGAIEDKLQQKEKRPRKEKEEKSAGRGRGRGRPDTIQSASIFEQGPTERIIKKESFSHGAGGSGDSGGFRSSSTKAEKHDEAADQKILNRILQDDVMEADDDDFDVTYQPVVLPLLQPIKQEVSKHEAGDHESKPLVSQESNWCSEVLDCDSDSAKLVLVQLPDCLPGLTSGDAGAPRKHVKQEPGINTDQSVTDGVTKALSLCKLSDLGEGRIGKLQILRSGKVRLILGTVSFDVSRGALSGFLQELMYVRGELMNGEVANLGQVREKLVIVPNIETLLSNS